MINYSAIRDKINTHSPKQFEISAKKFATKTCVITAETAEQINKNFRKNCAEHDAEDRESWSVAATIYAGN